MRVGAYIIARRYTYAELASALLAGCTGRFGKEEITAEVPIGQTTVVIYDLLDLMREDLRPNPSLLNRVREHWSKVALDRLPHAEDLTRLVHSDELLRISGAQHRFNDSIAMQGTSIDFLPSRHGSGYSATISGFWGEYDVEGWVAGAYDDLHGIAVEPEPERLEASVWLRFVRRRLPEQGVIFIPREGAKLPGHRGRLLDRAAWWDRQVAPGPQALIRRAHVLALEAAADAAGPGACARRAGPSRY